MSISELGPGATPGPGARFAPDSPSRRRRADREENLIVNELASRVDDGGRREKWERRLADLWASMDSHGEEEFLARRRRISLLCQLGNCTGGTLTR